MQDLNFLLDEFKWFHQHPERSFEEVKTAKRILSILNDQGIDCQSIADTGVLALINADKPDLPCIAIRADIDALPIVETTDLPYKSIHDGTMHACGHDSHITIGLGLTIRLQEMKDNLPYRVKVIFQPGEETSLGALKITNEHLTDDCAFVFGFHADPTLPVNTLGISSGAVAAAVDHFLIEIEGVGAHGAHPDTGIDPIVAATTLAQGLNTIVSRNMDPSHAALVSTTRIQSGNTWNVIPSTATLEGTYRSLDTKDRALIGQRIQTLSNGIASAYQCHVNVQLIAGPPVLDNDSQLADYFTKLGKQCGYNVVEAERSLGGDDFSFYLENSKGIYIKFGTGIGPAIHHSDFLVDPSCILPFVDYMTQCIKAFDLT